MFPSMRFIVKYLEAKDLESLASPISKIARLVWAMIPSQTDRVGSPYR